MGCILAEQDEAAAMVAELSRAVAKAKMAEEGGEWLLLRSIRRLRIGAREMGKSVGGAMAFLAYILSSSWAGMAAKEATLAALLVLPLSSGAAIIPQLASGAGNILRNGGINGEAKIMAAKLVEKLAAAAEQRDAKLALGYSVDGLVDLLKGRTSDRAVRASIRALVALFPLRRNRVRAVEAGAVAGLVDILLGDSEYILGLALTALEMLCKCAEGREAVLANDSLAVEAIAGKLNVKNMNGESTQCALRLLCCICERSPECAKIHRRLVDAGVFSRLMIMLQMEFACKNSSSDSTHLLRLICGFREHCPDVAMEERIIFRS